MSKRILEWAHRQTLASNPAFVLRSIAWHYNDQRKCAWPSQETIARESNGISVATVKRCLKDLERMGIVGRVYGGSGTNRRVAYTIDWTGRFCWKRSVNKCSWKEYVRQQEEAFTSHLSRPGESRADFVKRQEARLRSTPK